MGEKQLLPEATEQQLTSISMWDPTQMGRFAYRQMLRAQEMQELANSQKQRAEEMEKLANYDMLTGIPNRRAINPYFDQEVSRLSRHNAKYGLSQGMDLLILDLDGFKTANDKLGHQAGDDILRDSAQSLSDTLREYDLVCRLGGDEFIIVLTGTEESEDTSKRIEAIGAAVDRTIYSAEHGRINISTSIGVSEISSQDVDNLAKMTEQQRHEEIATRMLEADENMFIDKNARKAGR